MNIYFHIPFCLKKCTYCNFTSFIDWDNDLIANYFLKIKNEFISRNINTISTLYLGGGTPSVVPLNIWEKFFSFIQKKLRTDKIEITMEINPRNADTSYLNAVKSFGVNRISIGIQSFENNIILKNINRDKVSTVYNALSNIFKIFDNVNIDLISGLPFSDYSSFKKDLNIAVLYPVTHLSVYELENYKNLKNVPTDDEMIKIEKFKKSFLKKNGFERYEISNYARNKKYCKHNLDFWMMKDYAGIGCAAVSQTGKRIRANSETLKGYFKNEFEEYELTIDEYIENFLSRTLRTKFGFNKNDFESNFGTKFDFIKYKKYLVLENENVKLKEKYIDFLNRIIDEILAG